MSLATGELKSISKLIPMARRKQYFGRSQVQQLELYMDEEQDGVNLLKTAKVPLREATKSFPFQSFKAILELSWKDNSKYCKYPLV